MSRAMARFARSGVNQMRAALMQTTQDVNPAYARLGAHARLMSSVGNQAPQGAGAANVSRGSLLETLVHPDDDLKQLNSARLLSPS